MTKPTKQQVEDGAQAIMTLASTIAMEALEREPDERAAYIEQAVAKRRNIWVVASDSNEKSANFLDGLAGQLSKTIHGLVTLMEQSGGRPGHG